MNKKVLGIAIPYWKNTAQCEKPFQDLMGQINNQITDDMFLYIYEDGQYSEWLDKYTCDNIKIVSNLTNMGVSYARNQCLDYLKDKVLYILFLDSDDRIDDNYIKTMYEYCADNTHEIIESGLYVKDQKFTYDPKVVRCGVAGSAIQTKIIGDNKFNEHLQIGEDTDFMKRVCDLTKYRKKFAPTYYHYQLGINDHSLTISYQRNMIGKERK